MSLVQKFLFPPLHTSNPSTPQRVLRKASARIRRKKTQLIASVFHKKNCVIAFYGVHYPNGTECFMTASSNLELNDSRRPFLHPGSLPGVSRWLKTKIQSEKEQ